jgi:hypothetical protein
MKKLHFLSIATGVALLFTSCVGPEGPEGPEGPSGVANINISIYDIANSYWTSQGTYFSAPVTDNAVAATNNEVSVAFSTNGSDGPWQGMPTKSVFNSGDQLTFAWTSSQVTFFYDNATLNGVPSDVWFNVAVIPPAIYKKYPNVNFKDVSQLAQLSEWKAAMKVAKYITVSEQANSSKF